MPSIRSASCAVALVLCSAAAHAQFAAGYTLTVIGQGQMSTETGGTPSINNAGQVVMGFYSAPARVWQNGVFTTLESGAGATAAFINNSGQVVGANRDSFVPYGWFGPAGTGPRTQLAVSGTQAFPEGINDAGDVVVSSAALGGRVYHSSTGTFSSTGLRAGNGIDNTGRVFGDVLVNGIVRAAVSVDGVATVLPGNNANAMAFTGNTAGFIAGHYRASGGSQAYPLLWSPVPVSPENPSGFTVTPLPMPAGMQISERIIPAAMNEAGFIVGYMHGQSGSAYAWHQGAVIDLNTRLTAAPGLPIAGWHLAYATDVNDLGQIVGIARLGGVEHVVLLNPVPAPGAAGLLMLGGLAAAHRRRRN